MHPGDQLSAYLDGEVDEDTRVSIEAHLAGCEACRDELAIVSDMRSLVRALPMLDPVGETNRPADVISIRPSRRRTLVAAAAVATLVVGIGFGVGASREVPLQLNEVVEQHVARASVDPGFNVLQVQAVVNP